MKPVPYFSQWESRDLTAKALAEGFAEALSQDPNWRTSGARSVEEYAAWAWNVCGMACLKMVLAARTGRVWPTLELARRCSAYGGYVVETETGAIIGLIYTPFVEFVRAEFDISAEVVTGVTAHDLPELFERAEFFIASVHSSIRLADGRPPARGGHLVLATQATARAVVFHNPSGFDRDTQEDVAMDINLFGRYFAGRGIAILNADAGAVQTGSMP